MTKKLTTETFINKAKLVHGDLYDYSLVEYVNSRSKVTMICNSHGEFSQKPNNHLALKQGCPECGGTKKSTISEFINKAKLVHGDLYDYLLVEYINNRFKIIINCTDHGEFTQTPRDHLQGYGCPTCAGVKRITTDDFIRKSILKHGSTYNYDKSKYINKNTKVAILCSTHGEFLQLPGNHYNLGQGCPMCSKTGYKVDKVGVVYVLRSKCGEHVKVGITNNITNRLNQLANCTPFEFNIIHKLSTTGNNAKNIEKSLHSIMVCSGFSNFNGATEWFKFDGDLINTIIDYIK